MNNRINSLLIVGNGFDISLEMETKISNFLEWVNNLPKDKLKIILKSEDKIEKFGNFLKYYDNWWKNNNIKINHWSDLENSIVIFLTNIKIIIRNLKNLVKVNEKNNIRLTVI